MKVYEAMAAATGAEGRDLAFAVTGGANISFFAAHRRERPA